MPSERWQVPEPSDEAIAAARDPIQQEVRLNIPLRYPSWFIHNHLMAEALRGAFAADLPGIVRAECLALLDAILPLDKSKYREAMRYLSTRFDAPSAEGERCENTICKKPKGHTEACFAPTPPPPPAPREPVHPCACGHREMRGEHWIDKCVWDDGARYYPPSDTPAPNPCAACGCAACRARTQFVGDWARHVVLHAADYPSRLVAAARTVTEAR